ncbi:MBL fold metallo-hydrolase [Pseudonocardia hydrocarbonoxydans]|uniref:MBL fold metallo-hydrolase n=1 Tax=Pseudonocardia hydrocarbonoxydans TaxID=76726 RepID=A0A4Y3WI37_9PSEU|nr:MBL fold metallo-hydrolase [Pseudonocardia hydrocarbonoxydans]GEC18622.1 MBL fold metallo-hydrolase [Pseudonocardia hydrocarbonoxydans]
MIDVEVIETSSLGDRSYLASDGEVAVVVDPQRDVDRVLALAGRLGVRITHVVETHVHNDYVSGGLELARLTGAAYVMSAQDDLAFERTGVVDGDVLEASPRLRLRVLATPGHTFHHLSYVLEGADGPQGVFTGGSLLYGTTGRTDLLGDEHAEALARAQHASAAAMADALPDGAQVWPTHGFGSFCTATPASGNDSTIGHEKQVNPVLRLARDEFVRETLAGLGAYPAYYAHMGALNTAGPAPVDLRPPTTADPAELARRLGDGEWVVDLRHRKAYLASHLAGTVSLGLDGPMATWLGWMAPHGAPITLLGDTPDQVAQAQRELVRIGVDRIVAAATGDPHELAVDPARLGELPSAGFVDLAGELDGRRSADLPPAEVVLDVRLGTEWDASHVRGAVHVPLPELPDRLDEVPAGSVWVHCGSGYRATAAASLLARAGRTVVVIDDNYGDAERAGVPLTTTP